MKGRTYYRKGDRVEVLKDQNPNDWAEDFIRDCIDNNYIFTIFEDQSDTHVVKISPHSGADYWIIDVSRITGHIDFLLPEDLFKV